MTAAVTTSTVELIHMCQVLLGYQSIVLHFCYDPSLLCLVQRGWTGTGNIAIEAAVVSFSLKASFRI